MSVIWKYRPPNFWILLSDGGGFNSKNKQKLFHMTAPLSPDDDGPMNLDRNVVRFVSFIREEAADYSPNQNIYF